jgi:hypothetical protein
MAGEHADPEQVARQIFDLTADGRQDVAVSLFHPEFATVTTTIGEPRVLRGHEEFAAFVQEVVDTYRIREVRAQRFTRLGDDMVVVDGRVRFSSAQGGGFSDVARSWAFELKDGLVWRQRTVGSHDEALRVARERDWGV